MTWILFCFLAVAVLFLFMFLGDGPKPPKDEKKETISMDEPGDDGGGE